MTRDSKTISAVFMAVVLVIASGAAVSLAVTATDGGTNAMGVQDTTTEDGVTTTEDGETDEDDGATDEEGEQQASVTIDDQESEGERVVIESATLPESGFIAIHEAGWDEASPAAVLGNSVYLEAGNHENVTITLARPLDETSSVAAMIHSDTNDNQVFDYVLSSGNLDGPITEGDSPVSDDAEVTVEQETTTTEETTTTTTEDGVDTVTTAEDGVDTITTEEDGIGETVTTEEDGIGETVTTEEDDVAETVTTDEETADGEMQQFVFKVDQMNVDRWSFVVGDEETPDETVYVNGSELLPPDGSLSDERVTVNLSELQEQGEISEDDLMYTTTRSPEEIEEDIERNLTGDIQTVRYVIQNVNVENVTLVVLAPSDVDFPAQPTMEETTDEEEFTTEETTTEETTTEETTTEETTTEETTTEETTTEEEFTTDEEFTTAETTTTEEETTTTEEETTTTEEETTTTEEETPTEDAESFDVSGLSAPDSVTAGETLEVSATVSNDGDAASTQTVAFRLDGDVVQQQQIALDPGEQTNVTFEVDTSELEPDQYVHGVYTAEFGEVDVIVLEESTGGDDAGDADDADEGDAGDDTDETDPVTTDTTTEADDTSDADDTGDDDTGDDTGDTDATTTTTTEV